MKSVKVNKKKLSNRQVSAIWKWRRFPKTTATSACTTTTATSTGRGTGTAARPGASPSGKKIVDNNLILFIQVRRVDGWGDGHDRLSFEQELENARVYLGVVLPRWGELQQMRPSVQHFLFRRLIFFFLTFNLIFKWII